MNVEILYGRDSVTLDVPQSNFGGLIKPRAVKGREVRAELEKALNNSMGEPLERLSKGKTVCVLVEDDTRAAPHQEIISCLTRRLAGAEGVRFIVATGSHDPNTEGNREIVAMIRNASERHGIPLTDIHVHDCFSQESIGRGNTSRNTPVIVDPRALGADLYVIGSDMKNHYFAGYSNALKCLLPGICAYDSIEANHSFALDPRSTFGIHPLHPDPGRRDNPLAEDMLEAKGMIVGDAPVFVLATVSTHNEVLWSGSGEIEEVTKEGIAVVDELASFKVDKTMHAVISPGGYPQDDSLYNAQRALELTKNAISAGGSVLLLAECRNGIAPSEKAKQNFYDRLTKPLDEVLESIKSRYELYSHKAYKFAEMISMLDSIQLYTELPDDVVRKAHLSKTPYPQAVIDNWIEDDPGGRILFFDDANRIAVYAN